MDAGAGDAMLADGGWGGGRCGGLMEAREGGAALGWVR